MLDPALMRLQYEIFNKSLETLAAESSIPVSILQKEATKQNWRQYWPVSASVPDSSDNPLDIEAGETASERLALEAESFIEDSRKRLQVYNLAKEILLSAKYLELEYAIVNNALDLAPSLDKATDIKALSALYKDLTSGSSMSSLAKMSIGQDENGMPSVIIRDLTGHRD